MKRLISLIAPMLLAAAIGCGGGAPPAQSPQGSDQTAQAQPAADNVAAVGENEDDSTADLADHHRHHHHGGFAMFIAMSLDAIGESPDQHDAIVKIQHDMHAKMQPAKDAEKAVLLALADGVAAGQVDQAKIDAAVAQLATASAGVHDAVADSINALHKTLTPPQRQALVDKLESHLTVWNHANAPDEPTAKDAHHGHIAQLAHELQLSPDQVDKIRESFASSMTQAPKYDRAEAEAHFQAFASAFTSENFDAHALTTGSAVNSHMATWGVNRMVRLYEAAAPVLTPDQRAKAADALRHHANYKRSDSET
ncbi:MAG TPA: Spy/CpxP family protein refolding chaperone [Kofleriaceae bacterium]|nr:Spy/CpxP family protein refolding chaperone [Kofleriaceae bacterium]